MDDDRTVRISRQSEQGTVLIFNDAGESIRVSEHDFDLYIATLNEAEVRADERRQVADLLEEHAETIGTFSSPNPIACVKLVAFLIRLGTTRTASSVEGWGNLVDGTPVHKDSYRRGVHHGQRGVTQDRYGDVHDDSGEGS